MMSNIAIFENIAGMSMFGGNVKIITIYYIIFAQQMRVSPRFHISVLKAHTIGCHNDVKYSNI